MKYTSQHCCDKKVDNKMALYREFYKIMVKKVTFVGAITQIAPPPGSTPARIHGPCRRFRGDQNDEDTRTSYTTQLRVQTRHNTRIVLPVASTIARAEICLGC